MKTVRAWMQRLGNADKAVWPKIVASLQERKLVLSEEIPEQGAPGLLLLPPVCEEVVEQIASSVRKSTGPVLAIALRRSDLGNGGSWRLCRSSPLDAKKDKAHALQKTTEGRRFSLCYATRIVACILSIISFVAAAWAAIC